MKPKDIETLARTCQKVDDLVARVEKIETNHLPHIQKAVEDIDKRLDKLEQKLAYYLGAASIIATLISVLFEKIFK